MKKENSKTKYVQGNLFGDDERYSEPLGKLEKREEEKKEKAKKNKERREKAAETKRKKENDEKNKFTREHSMFKENKSIKLVRLTESDLHRIVENSVIRILKENNMDDEWGGNFHDPNETHFAVNKKTNLIVNGWVYNDIPSNELRSEMNYYFGNDLYDNGFNPKDYKIYTKRTLNRMGINVDLKSNWSNDGIIPLKDDK